MDEKQMLISLLIVWLAIYLLGRVLPLKKYGLDIKPFFVKYESERFKRILSKCSDRQRVLWRLFSHISVFSGFVLMVFAIGFLSINLMRPLLRYGREVTVVPIIPGLTLDPVWLPYFLIAVLVAILTHEAAHGIIALTEGVKVKSAGLLAFAIFPGGFVEVNEEEMNRLPRISRMRIFSAGSSSNLVFGLMALLVTWTLFSPVPSGIVVINVLEKGPLHEAGIGRWDIIYALNDTKINTYLDLSAFMSRAKPGDRLMVSTSKGNFLITVIQSPEDKDKAIIGLLSPYIPYYRSRLGLSSFLDTQIYLTLSWLLSVLFSVVIFNMLPIPMLDGDRFLQCLIEKASEKSYAFLKKFFNVLSLFLMVANMAVSLRLW
ncbi:MAG: site-2 protease family protein [Candidatus Bathyarchaeia archaeon]